jgi:fumarate reductase subunit C
VGVYRLVLKWGTFAPRNSKALRRSLRRVTYAVIGGYLLLGLLSLGAYIAIGIDHSDRVGERYYPASFGAGEEAE